MYKLLFDFKPKMLPSYPAIEVTSTSNTSSELKWDDTKCGTGISFENNKTLVFLKEQAYVFRSVITSFGFTSGVHYWEIVADGRT
jgi:hypothetical protein